MSSTKIPVIGRIPAEIHLQAQSLGLIAETYTHVVAGHGPTGQVAWAVSWIQTDGVWTDAVSLRSGIASTHENARAALRNALDSIAGHRGEDA